MNHSKVRARLSDYVERDLSPKERSRMKAHLADCPDCARELRELESTVALLRRLPEAKPPPAFAATVMARVRAGEAEAGGLLRWLRALTAPAFAVPLAVGLAGVVLFAGLRDAPFEQPAAGTGPALRIAVGQPPPQPAVGPGAHPAVRAAAGPATRAAQVERDARVARAMRSHSPIEELARRGRTKAVALTLRGAGHPLSTSMASHFEDQDDHGLPNVVFASWSP